MIKIKGSYGEGGGAIIRNSLALSLITQKPFEITNIRKNRSNPGLRAQHLKCVHAAQELSNAQVMGDKLHSTKLSFKPGKIQPQTLSVDIGTAGSTTLLIQSILPACITSEKKTRLRIRGGTDTKWSIPIDYLVNVFFPRINVKIKINEITRGYYPKGGGFVDINVYPKTAKKISLTELGELKQIKGVSHASSHLRKAKVAERQASSARKNLKTHPIKIKTEYINTLSVGSGICLWAEFDSGAIVGASCLGERGKRAEIVGKQAAERLNTQMKAPVDKYLADQLIVYLAMHGGKIKTTEITNHTKTNIHIAEKFLEGKFEVNNDLISMNLKNN